MLHIAASSPKNFPDRECLEGKVRKFIGKISIGFDYWFTFILNPDVEPINNRAERIGVSPNANRKTSQLNIYDILNTIESY
ncbi:hypothetical protein [Methanothrix sp.]|jgi:hypothetical protein|uniref:hypothetical protein n=1 Tax=Methanothrix sp. TaxID=90426 RepID=UPI00064F3B46|nr:hypothetical protein [Methanothrix sp.]